MIFSVNSAGTTEQSLAKAELGRILCTFHGNELKMGQRLNVKPTVTKLLEENLKENYGVLFIYDAKSTIHLKKDK